MARMFPSKIPDSVAADPRRAAEIRVYESLRDQLDGGFHVFYSSPWLGTRPDGSEIDGEADFLVAHPELGILSIEVKGGGVEINADNEWTSRDRYGFVRRIKNPVDQARSSKHQILQKLKESTKWKPRYVRACHGVVLSDVSSPGKPMRPDMPLELFAFREDLTKMNAWVRSRFRQSAADDAGSGSATLGSDGLAALDAMLAEPIRLKVPLATGVDAAIREIRLKTEEQVWILRDLEENHRMTIAGAAGTGKTILAVEKSLMLEEAGKRTLLLCFNRPLSGYLQQLVGGRENLTVTHFDQFCRDAAEAADNGATHDINTMRYQFVENFVTAGWDEFDAIVIDEGQDFTDEWLSMLEVVVRNSEDGTLYIFYDDNQNVTGSSAGYITSMPASRYRLSRNFRNTKSIFDESSKYYRGNSVKPVGPEGMSTEWHACDSKLREAISQRAGSLIKAEGLTAGDITVLVPSVSHIDHLRVGENVRIGSYETVNAENRRHDAITVDSIRRFKGLESPVVILVISGTIEKHGELLYTGMSRAQARLEVFGPGHVLAAIK